VVVRCYFNNDLPTKFLGIGQNNGLEDFQLCMQVYVMTRHKIDKNKKNLF
jgi:hypothetical protein